MSKSNPEADGLSPEAANLARNMRVELFPPGEGDGDAMEAVVDFLMAVKLRRDKARAEQRSAGPADENG